MFSCVELSLYLVLKVTGGLEQSKFWNRFSRSLEMRNLDNIQLLVRTQNKVCSQKEGLVKNVWPLSWLVNVTKIRNKLIISELDNRIIIHPQCPFGVFLGRVCVCV